jgi:hypothetical protein
MRQYRFGWILLGAGLLAIVSARPYAGGWNDGSRLATVESLVDRHTLAIDESVYVAPAAAAREPYAPGNSLLAEYGTLDKLYVAGRFYSDKSPVPAVLMAGVYQCWRSIGGPSAADRPDWFARMLTWLFAGAPFVLAVAAIGRTMRHFDVPEPWDLLLTGSVAFGSLALPYAAQVNNHILLFAVAAGVCETIARPGPIAFGRAAWLGALAGFGYTIDLGAGPPLAVAVTGIIIWRVRESGGSMQSEFVVFRSAKERSFAERKTTIGDSPWSRVAIFALFALPFVAAHHAITYAMAGTIGPANASAEFFRWPGSPFTESNMTGGWNHSSPMKAGLYALDLLFGKKGFLLFSPPMLLAVFASVWLVKRPRVERSTIVALAAWAIGTWLLYAATSRNLSGQCLSVRWFVPLLAPGYLVLGLVARDVPQWRRDILVLCAGGLLLTGELVVRGPWYGRIPIMFWPVVGCTLAAWAGVVVARLRQAESVTVLAFPTRTEERKTGDTRRVA